MLFPSLFPTSFTWWCAGDGQVQCYLRHKRMYNTFRWFHYEHSWKNICCDIVHTTVAVIRDWWWRSVLFGRTEAIKSDVMRMYWKIKLCFYDKALNWQQMETFAFYSRINKGKYFTCFFPDWPYYALFNVSMSVCVSERERRREAVREGGRMKRQRSEFTHAWCLWSVISSLVLMNHTLSGSHSLSLSL